MSPKKGITIKRIRVNPSEDGNVLTFEFQLTNKDILSFNTNALAAGALVRAMADAAEAAKRARGEPRSSMPALYEGESPHFQPKEIDARPTDDGSGMVLNFSLDPPLNIRLLLQPDAAKGLGDALLRWAGSRTETKSH